MIRELARHVANRIILSICLLNSTSHQGCCVLPLHARNPFPENGPRNPVANICMFATYAARPLCHWRRPFRFWTHRRVMRRSFLRQALAPKAWGSSHFWLPGLGVGHPDLDRVRPLPTSQPRGFPDWQDWHYGPCAIWHFRGNQRLLIASCPGGGASSA